MKTPLLPISIVAVCAAAFVGCEWGGVHSGESWNDAYSWANFTGTYKLVNAVSAEDSGSSSSSTDGTTSTSTTEKQVTATASCTVASGATSAEIKGLKTPVVPGSVTVNLGGYKFVDDGAGNLDYQGSGDATYGRIVYSTGAIALTFGEMHGKLSGTATYAYTIKNSVQATTAGSGGSTSTTTVSAPITWLNLAQKGNLLTFSDNAGRVYSGRITSASCPKADDAGYVTAGHIRFSFEATCTSNSAITLAGSISGDWSGASTATTGTIANRTIDATFHNGRTGVQFQAVSGTTTVYAREVTPTAGTTD